MHSCINDGCMQVICVRMFICMNICMNECMSTWIYDGMNVRLRRLYITSEADKTGQVRWETDWHRSTNTRQSSLWDDIIGDESNHCRGKVRYQTTDERKLNNQNTKEVKPIHQKPGRNRHHSNHMQETPLIKP